MRRRAVLGQRFRMVFEREVLFYFDAGEDRGGCASCPSCRRPCQVGYCWEAYCDQSDCLSRVFAGSLIRLVAGRYIDEIPWPPLRRITLAPRSASR